MLRNNFLVGSPICTSRLCFMPMCFEINIYIQNFSLHINYWQGCRPWWYWGAMADQLTLSQTGEGGRSCPPINTSIPGFSDLPTALLWIVTRHMNVQENRQVRRLGVLKFYRVSHIEMLHNGEYDSYKRQ